MTIAELVNSAGESDSLAADQSPEPRRRLYWATVEFIRATHINLGVQIDDWDKSGAPSSPIIESSNAIAAAIASWKAACQ